MRKHPYRPRTAFVVASVFLIIVSLGTRITFAILEHHCYAIEISKDQWALVGSSRSRLFVSHCKLLHLTNSELLAQLSNPTSDSVIESLYLQSVDESRFPGQIPIEKELRQQVSVTISPFCNHYFFHYGGGPTHQLPYLKQRTQIQYNSTVFIFPLDVLLLVPLIVFGSSVLRGLQGSARNRSERCVRCDYDLTGNLSGICSECGLKFSAVPSVPDAHNMPDR